MFFFRGRDGHKNKNQQGQNDQKPSNDDAPAKPDPKSSKNTLRSKFNAAVKGLRTLTLRDLSGTTGQTLRDLRQPKEIGLLVVAMIVPGGMFGWGAYRLKKFKSGQNATDHKPANENLPAPQKDAAAKTPVKKGKKPKPPGR